MCNFEIITNVWTWTQHTKSGHFTKPKLFFPVKNTSFFTKTFFPTLNKSHEYLRYYIEKNFRLSNYSDWFSISPFMSQGH